MEWWDDDTRWRVAGEQNERAQVGTFGLTTRCGFMLRCTIADNVHTCAHM